MSDWISNFETRGWAELKEFVSPSIAMGIRAEIDSIKQHSGLRQASIGKLDQKIIDTSQRGDFIRWIDANSAAPNTKTYLDRIAQLIQELNYHFYLGIRDYECHYAHYPPGTFYKKHVDRHKAGSPRRVSSVLYLNPDWTQADGGELVVYPPSESRHSIQPTLGTLAIFLSELEHEVLVTHKDRMSITGWMLTETIL